MQPYAETKAQGEKAVRDACGTQEGDLLTIAVAPHQVNDLLFVYGVLIQYVVVNIIIPN